MSRQMIIYESVLDDLESVKGNAADTIVKSPVDDSLRPPGFNGWTFQFEIAFPTISKYSPELEKLAREAIKSKESIEEVLQSTHWIEEYSQVWIHSVPIGKDVVVDGVTIHASNVGGGTYLRFSLCGRPHNTMQALRFMLAIIQCVRPAYDKDGLYNMSDYIRVKYEDNSVLDGANYTSFEYFDQFYFVINKKPFNFEWTREANKTNFPWYVFKRLLGFVSVLIPGSVEPYYRLKQLFNTVVDEFPIDKYTLEHSQSMICDTRYAYSPGIPGDLKLKKIYKDFFMSHPISVNALQNSDTLNETGYCLMCPAYQRDKTDSSSIYEFGRPLKHMDNFIREDELQYILNCCEGQNPKSAYLKLFKKEIYAFIAFYMGSFAPNPTQGPVDVFVGIRYFIGNYTDNLTIRKFAENFCEALTILFNNITLPNEFHEYLIQTISKKY